MKQLRILTGNHAGAQVSLAPGTHRVSADEHADIRILDWTGDDVLLAVDEAGNTSARRVTDRALPRSGMPDEIETPSGEPGVVLMIDYVPMPFDDTVVCVGVQGAAWPSDLALLSTLLTRTGDPVANGGGEAAGLLKRLGPRRLLALGACVVVGAIALGGILTFVLQRSRANRPPTDIVMTQQANSAFASAGLAELHAASNGHGGVVVTGMVSSRSDDYIVRQMLTRIAPDAATRQYGIAEDTARSINEALAINGTQVVYRGHGVFSITGTVADAAAVNNAVARVRGDLDKSVKQVQVEVTAQSSDPIPAPALAAAGTYSMLVSSGRVQYTQTADGVKHIYTSGDTQDSSDDADAFANPQDMSAVHASNDVANASIIHSKEQFHVQGN